jgi:hypothetical protein
VTEAVCIGISLYELGENAHKKPKSQTIAIPFKPKSLRNVAKPANLSQKAANWLDFAIFAAYEIQISLSDPCGGHAVFWLVAILCRHSQIAHPRHEKGVRGPWDGGHCAGCA